MTSGDGTSAYWVCQSPPLEEALGIGPWLTAPDPVGDTCRRLETMALSQTGEIPRRPIVGKPSL